MEGVDEGREGAVVGEELRGYDVLAKRRDRENESRGSSAMVMKKGGNGGSTDIRVDGSLSGISCPFSLYTS